MRKNKLMGIDFVPSKLRHESQHDYVTMRVTYREGTGCVLSADAGNHFSSACAERETLRLWFAGTSNVGFLKDNEGEILLLQRCCERLFFTISGGVSNFRNKVLRGLPPSCYWRV
jgi:hypothetical protein